MQTQVQQPLNDVKDSRQRFKEAHWFDWLQEKWVLVLGQGSIGSWTTLFLSRIGCNIYSYDMDVVSSLNMAGQFYGLGSVGKFKVTAIKEALEEYSQPNKMIFESTKYDENGVSMSITIAAFDNMLARKVAFNNWVEYVNILTEGEKKQCIFIDGRLSVEDYYIYAVRPGQEEEYRKTLFDDSEGEELSCSLKSTSHCAAGIASDITSILTNFAVNVKEDCEIREVPFSIHKSIQSYTYETK